MCIVEIFNQMSSRMCRNFFYCWLGEKICYEPLGNIIEPINYKSIICIFQLKIENRIIYVYFIYISHYLFFIFQSSSIPDEHTRLLSWPIKFIPWNNLKKYILNAFLTFLKLAPIFQLQPVFSHLYKKEKICN